MPTFSYIWRSMFFWVLFLIVVSQLASFFIFKVKFDNYEFKQAFIERAAELAATLEGESLAGLTVVSDAMNRSKNKFWVRRADGTPVVGRFMDKQEFSQVDSMANGTVTVLRSPLREDLYITATPFSMQDGPAIMYLVCRQEDIPPTLEFFYQGFITVLVLGGALSAWVIWRISQPLKMLCDEVLEITDGHLDKRVSVTGKGEVGLVAVAVNQLADSLSKNIHKLRVGLANFSHEMRSPLTRMNLSLAIIEEGLLASGKHATKTAPSEKMTLAIKHLRSMQKEIDHMERLIGSSLLTSKLALQQQEWQLEPIAFSDLCVEMIRRHEPVLHSKSITLTQDIRPGLWVMGDEALLCMVLSNLLDNVGKYTQEGGRARCVLSVAHKKICLDIVNSYQTVSEETLALIFYPFFRGLATGYDDGVGLGLALVEKIIAIHKGTVSARNTEQGLLFSIQLDCIEKNTVI